MVDRARGARGLWRIDARRRLGGAAMVLAGSALLAGGCGGGDPPPAERATATKTTAAPPQPRFFAATSVWNAPLADADATASQSQELTSSLVGLVHEEVAAKVGPWISTTGFSTPIYTVPASQPPVPVQLDAPEPRLQRAFEAVPLPADARPADGSDAQLTVSQPSSDRLWEFWHLRREGDGWHAGWGGAMRQVSQDPGVFTAGAWPGATSRWGATATSLPLVGGLITLEDLHLGHIDHAVALGVPRLAKAVVRSPAQRTDGTAEGPSAIPAGTHFRLDPKLDLQRLALPPLTLMIAEAAQRYGIVVRDTSSVVDFYGEDPTPTGSDPYRALIGGEYPWQQLAKFPWEHLQALAAGDA